MNRQYKEDIFFKITFWSLAAYAAFILAAYFMFKLFALVLSSIVRLIFGGSGILLDNI